MWLMTFVNQGFYDMYHTGWSLTEPTGGWWEKVPILFTEGERLRASVTATNRNLSHYNSVLTGLRTKLEEPLFQPIFAFTTEKGLDKPSIVRNTAHYAMFFGVRADAKSFEDSSIGAVEHLNAIQIQRAHMRPHGRIPIEQILIFVFVTMTLYALFAGIIFARGEVIDTEQRNLGTELPPITLWGFIQVHGFIYGVYRWIYRTLHIIQLYTKVLARLFWVAFKIVWYFFEVAIIPWNYVHAMVSKALAFTAWGVTWTVVFLLIAARSIAVRSRRTASGLGNRMALPSFAGRWQEFRTLALDAHHIGSLTGSPDFALDPSETYVPAVRIGKDRLDLATALEATGGIHVLISPADMKLRPAGNEQFHRAYELRNNAPRNPVLAACDVTCGHSQEIRPEPTCALSNLWVQATADYLSQVLFKFNSEEIKKVSKDEWARSLPSAMKKGRAIKAVESLSEGVIKHRTKCFLKADECLYPKDLGLTRGVGLKGRVVQGVDTTVVASTIPIINKIMKAQKEFLRQPESVFESEHWLYRLDFGSGMNDVELEQWYDSQLEWVAHTPIPADKVGIISLIVAGDDTLGLYRTFDDGCVKFFENDYSKFDSTQGIHALHAEYLVLYRCGMKASALYALKKTQESVPIFVDRKGEEGTVLKPAPTQRFSGGGDTTFGNGTCNLIALVHALQFPSTNFSKRISELGFECKAIHGSIRDPHTFLKGWWIERTDDPSKTKFVCLPSQACNLGKISCDPQKATQVPDQLTALKLLAHSISLSLKNIPYRYPLLDALRRRYLAVLPYTPSPVPGYNPVTEHAAQRFSSYRVGLNQEQLDHFLQVRYGIEPEDWIEMDRMILDAPFPGILCSPLFSKVIARDYA